MRALVLSGGGAKGSWQLGALKRWMHDDQLDYDIMTGVSVGALIVSRLAHTPIGNPSVAINDMIELWNSKVETKNIYKRWFPFGRIHSLWSKSVYDSSPLRDLVYQNFDQHKILASGKKVAVGVVSLSDGEHRFVMSDTHNFVDWVLASASFPVFLSPVEIDGKLWSDGWIKNVTPLSQAIHLGATEIDVIMTSDPWSNNKWNSLKKRAIPDQIVRTLNLMSDQIMQNDIKTAGLKNEFAKLEPKYKIVKIRLLVPSVHLTDDSLEFDRDVMKKMFEQGYNDAQNSVVYY